MANYPWEAEPRADGQGDFRAQRRYGVNITSTRRAARRASARTFINAEGALCAPLPQLSAPPAASGFRHYRQPASRSARPLRYAARAYQYAAILLAAGRYMPIILRHRARRAGRLPAGPSSHISLCFGRDDARQRQLQLFGLSRFIAVYLLHEKSARHLAPPPAPTFRHFRFACRILNSAG